MIIIIIIIITRGTLSRAQVSPPGSGITNMGLHSTDKFQIVMKTSLSQCTSLENFLENMISSLRLVGSAIAGV